MRTNLERIKKDIENLSEFNATPCEGLTRFSFTKEDLQAREYLKNELKKLNVEIYEDQGGTLFAKREGIDKSLPSIMIGSHFDSVKNGGNFDGPAGVVTALEILRVLEEKNIQTKYPIEFVAMVEEEGARFGGGLLGSRAIAGLVDYEELKKNKDENGISIAQAMKEFGFNPKDVKKARRNPKDIKAFIELHIEQGPFLENKNIDIGIVDYIVGIHNINIIIKGRADHAGTTPMEMRADALSTASKVISNIDTYALDEKNGSVATVGIIKANPGSTNIVPGDVIFTVDIRSKEYNSIERIKTKIKNKLDELTQTNKDLFYEIIPMLDVKPVELSKEIIELFKNNVEKSDFSYRKMSSGAGHDSMIMAGITNVGMLFVPSKNGRSHCPEEWTDYKDLQKGIELVYDVVLDLGETK